MKQRNAFGKKALDLLNCYLSKEAITFLQVVLERDGDFTLAVDPKIIFRVKWLKKQSLEHEQELAIVRDPTLLRFTNGKLTRS